MVYYILKLTKIALFIAVLAISYITNAQQLENSLLWKISGNGLDKPSYLYGTMHAVCETNINADVLKAFDETSQLYLEIDMDDPKLQSEMMKGLMMKDGKTITSLLTEEDAKTLDAFLQKNLGMSLKMIDTFKPFMISSMFLPKLLGCPMKTVDIELMKISAEQKEDVFGLETIGYQLSVFDEIPYDVQIKEILKTAKGDLSKEKKEINEMLKIYSEENIEAMLTFTEETDNEMTKGYEDQLLNNRNKKWIPVIEKAAKAKPTFFGVGAAHLAGKNGVINLLKKAGYKVEPVL